MAFRASLPRGRLLLADTDQLPQQQQQQPRPREGQPGGPLFQYCFRPSVSNHLPSMFFIFFIDILSDGKME